MPDLAQNGSFSTPLKASLHVLPDTLYCPSSKEPSDILLYHTALFAMNEEELLYVQKILLVLLVSWYVLLFVYHFLHIERFVKSRRSDSHLHLFQTAP